MAVDLALVGADDEMLDWVVQIPGVTQLDLSRSRITDEGAAKLSALKQLEFLNLSYTPISDAGLKPLAAKTGLKYLVLNGTQVTDESLVLLAPSDSIQGVSLLETSVTPAGVEAFKKQHPNCTIIYRDPQASPQNDSQPNTVAPAETPADAQKARKPLPLPQTDDPTQSAASIEPLSGSTLAWHPDHDVESAFHKPDVVAKDLDDPEFLDALSKTYFDRGEWSKAAGVLKRAVVLNENNRKLRYHLGVALGRSGRLDASFSELRTASGEAAAHYNLGVIIYENALEKSCHHFQRALELDPDLKSAQYWLRDLQSQEPKSIKPEIVPASGMKSSKPR